MGSVHIIKGSSSTASFSMVCLQLPTIHSGFLWPCRPQIHCSAFPSLLQKLLQSGGNYRKLGELFEFSCPSSAWADQLLGWSAALVFFANVRRGAGVGAGSVTEVFRERHDVNAALGEQWAVKQPCNCAVTHGAVKTRSNLLWFTEQCYSLQGLTNPHFNTSLWSRCFRSQIKTWLSNSRPKRQEICCSGGING